MRRSIPIGLAALSAAIAAGWWGMTPPVDPAPDLTEGAPIVSVIVPASLGRTERLGETAFNAKCAACHGVNAAGRSGLGPPLVHVINEPGHHGDYAFEMAARNGVQAHHWPFGNMPEVDGLTTADIGAVTAYVRAVQRANGID